MKTHKFMSDGKPRKIQLCKECHRSFAHGNHERNKAVTNETPVDRSNYSTELAFKMETRATNARVDVHAFFAHERAEKELIASFVDRGFRIETPYEINAEALSSVLCHTEDSGLFTDPQTADKVAVFMAKNYRVTPR